LLPKYTVSHWRASQVHGLTSSFSGGLMEGIF
jgi:hypothetical protein